MYIADYTGEISELVEESHAIFNATTVSELMDMRGRQSQEDFRNKAYNNPEPAAINLSLDVVRRLDRATRDTLFLWRGYQSWEIGGYKDNDR